MEPTTQVRHYLAFRFSAMGDVALTVPALRLVLENNPHTRISLVTSPRFTSYFKGIERLDIIAVDLYGEFKGISGLFKLFKRLRGHGPFTAVTDLHGVIRTHILDLLFMLSGTRVVKIKKDRKQKKEYLQGKTSQKLIHSTDRYLEVYKRAGITKTGAKQTTSGGAANYPGFIINKATAEELITNLIARETVPVIPGTLIGIAPMAKHSLKMWPLENFAGLMELINKKHKSGFLFFGGGQAEKKAIDSLIKPFENARNLTGKLKLEQEIALISKMSFMITMDSANMHISALTGTPTLSIWGGTHPALGFSALNQPEEYSIQIPQTELSCRPCTVYGKGECLRGDLACLQRITPEMVYDRIKALELLK